MRRIWIAAVLAVVAGVAPGVSAAQTGPGANMWLEGFYSWNTYSMTEVNEDIGQVNELLEGSGLEMAEIDSGPGLGVRIGMDLRRLTLGAGYERLSAASDVSDATGGFQMNFPANAFYGLGEARIPASASVVMRLGVAGGFVILAPVPRIALTGPDAQSLELTGTGPLFETYATGEWWARRDLALFGSAGYRYAKVDEPRFTPEGGIYGAIDYSGALLRAGLKVGLRK